MSDMQIRALAESRGTVIFAESFVSSEQFTGLFREGMGLVEETATYLDGKGREDSKRLSRQGALGYATESMRLTTRLMQLASWLLLQRAVGEGELSRLQAERDKARISWKDAQLPSSTEALAHLPQGLLALIARSMRIQERICHLDRQITASLAGNAKAPTAGDNPVNEQITRLRSALQGFKA
ncbi:regulator of CtrA degradation [Rhizobiales bacterium GAS113]|nr:regulator of CtrA degradation [Rhizobiales bacterium GAS113]